jgi:hypothetical protein
MISAKGHSRKPDPLLLLIAAVVLGAFVSTAAMAGDPSEPFTKSDAACRISRQDSDGYSLARMGCEGAAVRVSMTPPRGFAQDLVDGRAVVQRQDTLSPVFLFVRYAW